jgi:hypothetical protein
VDASGQSIVDLVESALDPDGEEIIGLLGDMAGKITSQSVSAGTRFLDPLNAVVGLARGEDYTTPDRNQGNKALNDSFKYMDQILMALGKDMPQKYQATQGEPDIQATKFISTKREQKLTSLDRVYNLMGIPNWKAGIQTKDPKAKNRYNQLFNALNERDAELLLKNDRFRQGNEEERVSIFKKFAERNRKKVKDAMSRDTSPGDKEAVLIMEIETSGTALERENVMEEMGFDDLSELSYYELRSLKSALDTRKWTINR